MFREALRLEPLMPGTVRRAARAAVIAGVLVRPGDRVWLSIASANRDSCRWKDSPDEFVVPRDGIAEYLASDARPSDRAGHAHAEHLTDQLITALARRCTRLEPVDDLARSENTVQRPWRSLPVRTTADLGRVRSTKAGAGIRTSPQR